MLAFPHSAFPRYSRRMKPLAIAFAFVPLLSCGPTGWEAIEAQNEAEKTERARLGNSATVNQSGKVFDLTFFTDEKYAWSPDAFRARLDLPGFDDPDLTDGQRLVRGRDALDVGNLIAAAVWTHSALADEPNNPSTHEQLAKTLARLREARQHCLYNISLPTVLHHVHRAIEGDPRQIQAIRNDRDFKAVESSLLFRILLGYGGRTPNPMGLERVLAGTIYYGPVAGIYGNASKLELLDESKAIFRKLDDDNPTQWNVVQGNWTFHRGDILLEWPGVKAKHKLTLGRQGALLGENEAWSSLPSDCEA